MGQVSLQKTGPRGQEYLYAGRDNEEMDKPFHLYDLKATLAKMKRGTAPGRDKVTVKLLANLPDREYEALLTYIMRYGKGRRLCHSIGKHHLSLSF